MLFRLAETGQPNYLLDTLVPTDLLACFQFDGGIRKTGKGSRGQACQGSPALLPLQPMAQSVLRSVSQQLPFSVGNVGNCPLWVLSKAGYSTDIY